MSDVKCICGHEWQIHEWEGEGSYCLARTFPDSAFNTGEGVQCSCSGFVQGAGAVVDAPESARQFAVMVTPKILDYVAKNCSYFDPKFQGEDVEDIIAEAYAAYRAGRAEGL